MPSHRPERRRVGAAVLTGLVAALLLAPGPALAHADLIAADPADKATISTLPAQIVLTYDEDLFPGSSAALRSGGATIATSAFAGPLMTIDLPADLAPGEYEIRWTSVAGDGDADNGTLTFTYDPPPTPEPTPTPAPTGSSGASGQPTAIPTATPPPTPTPAPAASPTPTPGAEPVDIAIPLIGGLVILGVLAAVLLRGRQSGRSTE